ncbi:PadR family transcriptional regulator [Neptunicella sp.]|uniref:PadR family transcriptional regulator n=1 Tax=Neptunicella sp. TaxID=2125986 RepID=UPI003F68D9AE
MPIDPERLNKLTMELRRGVLILTALSSLKQEHYGYSLRKKLATVGLEIDEGTLYPLLRRLEDQGLLHSHWREEQGRKRRFYQTSPDGLDALQQMTNEWHNLNNAMLKLMEN